MRVGDVEIAVPVEAASVRHREARCGGRAAVPAEGLLAVAGDRGDEAGCRVDAAHPVLVGVGDVEMADGVEGDAHRVGGEGRFHRRTAVPGGAGPHLGGAAAGDRGDDPGGEIDGAQAVVAHVGEVECLRGCVHRSGSFRRQQDR